MKLSEIKKWIILESIEYLPWVFMAYISGIMISFNWNVNLYFVIGLIIISGIIYLRKRNNLAISWISLVCLFFLSGIINIKFHIYANQHPVLDRPLYQTPIQATVQENKFLIERQIITLNQIHWENPDLKMPQKIRLYLKSDKPILKAGDKIKAIVSVFPPDNTYSPEFYRQLWFEKIGATGVIKEIKSVQKNPIDKASFTKFRQSIHMHLFDILPRYHAEIIAPLITGEQQLIKKETYQMYRRAGIAHVLSVSGFHMALLSGFLFFLIRGICTLFPCISLYFNTKKIAAFLALIGTFLYLGISGFQIPAVRAFLMITLVFLGIFVNRTVISMRSLILIAFCILLISPEKIFSISFQLSFMAVCILVFICNKIQNKSWSKIKKSIIGFFVLNVFIFLGLTPFILYHFHQLTPYSILGNMLFSCLFTFPIMPLLFLGCLMMPFGLDKPFFQSAGIGLDIVHWGIEKINNLPYSEVSFNNFSAVSLSFISFGIILFCLMKTPLKWINLILIGIGFMGMFFP